MFDSDSLVGFTELGVALAGFSGIVAALTNRSTNWTPVDRHRLVTQLVLSFFLCFPLSRRTRLRIPQQPGACPVPCSFATTPDYPFVLPSYIQRQQPWGVVRAIDWHDQALDQARIEPIQRKWLWILLPFTVVVDAVTFPFQWIFKKVFPF